MDDQGATLLGGAAPTLGSGSSRSPALPLPLVVEDPTPPLMLFIIVIVAVGGGSACGLAGAHAAVSPSFIIGSTCITAAADGSPDEGTGAVLAALSSTNENKWAAAGAAGGAGSGGGVTRPGNPCCCSSPSSTAPAAAAEALALWAWLPEVRRHSGKTPEEPVLGGAGWPVTAGSCNPTGLLPLLNA